MTDIKKPPTSETSGRSKLRDRLEIQRAHDILACLLAGENALDPGNDAAGALARIMPDEEDRESMAVACDVLCWVLLHRHNHSFERNLAEVEKRLRAIGLEFRLVSDEPKTLYEIFTLEKPQ